MRNAYGNRRRTRHLALTAAILCAVVLAADGALAQSSLGIGAAEPSIKPFGPFAGVLQWINTQQQAFYRMLTGALKAMRDDDGAPWLLVGLSFAYGIFHAAGPGHGKAVISSYMLANEVALRRGVLLSFASALLQGLTAIVLMGVVFLALRGTAISMTDATWFLESVSFALIAAFGAWLLWGKSRRLLRRAADEGPPMHSLSAAHVGEAVARHAHDHDHGHDHGHHHAHHDHGPGEVCATCGHAHAPDPSRLTGDRLDWKTAASAIAAVGIRPCSGALIVLTFAFLNGLWLGGVLSVFAMSIGTAITVSILATLAVTAKNWAVALSGGGRLGTGIHNAIEIGGAALVMLLGLALLAASLSV
ncbi:nickel/cobalt transporter [Nitratireductor soli]|uniref:nickel/cobalt transporter n=1 Tax=Nitratireductor soli TaxID=1670619 RepID=UPI00065DD99D|nr:nickel/cobalt transporter [Nitratireductor soli]